MVHATNRAEALAMLQAGVSSTDKRLIHPKCIEALDLYGREGRPTGSFLMAVLSHDYNCILRADDQNELALPAICCYIHWELPSACHGSRERVAAWIKKHRRPTVEPAFSQLAHTMVPEASLDEAGRELQAKLEAKE